MELLKNLNEQQKKAVTHEKGPSLVIAGAGTGKTTVITNRVLWLIQNCGVKPDSIVALTFTDKAAHEMEERIDRLLPYGYTSIWAHTFHKFCEKILRIHGFEIGLHTDFRVITGTEQWLLVKNHLDRFDLNYFKPIGNPTKSIQILLNHFSRCKDEYILPKNYLEFIENIRLNNDARQLFEVGAHYEHLTDDEKSELSISALKKYDEVSKAYATYQKILEENNYLDFGDLITLTYRLFRERALVLDHYRNKFTDILVDEFQDTNSIQYNLVKLLAYPLNKLMVVGDDDQSIYRFRGASIKNIMQFKDDFPEAEEIVLTKNYRSNQKILDQSYKLIQNNNPYRLESKLGIVKKLESFTNESGIVEHLHCSTSENEVSTVIEKIKSIKNSNEAILWSDFAILMRANNHAQPFINALENQKIPFQFVASKGLYLKPIILDIISYLKSLYNHYDDSALYRVLNIPSFGISYDDCIKITHYTHQKGIGIFDALEKITLISGISENGVITCNLLRTLFSKQAQMLRETSTLSDLLVSFLHDSGYLDYLTKEDSIDNYYALTHLEQFHTRIKNYMERYPSGGLKEFLEIIALEFEAGETGSLHNESDFDSDKIQLMTVHSSKGLEFSYVFIVHMVDQRFPTRERSEALPIPRELVSGNDEKTEDDQHLSEERRLLYVAMTRAKKELYLTSAENYGGVRKKKLSPFLQEIGFSPTMNNLIKENKDSLKMTSDDSSIGVKNMDSKMKGLIPKKFSFTQLKDFNTCPLLYKYKYLFKVPTKGGYQMSFGSSMHKTLERFFREAMEHGENKQSDLFGDLDSKKIPDKKRLLELYELSWIDNWYKNKTEREKYKKLGHEILISFYDGYKAKIPETVRIEQAFAVKIGTYTITGRIDRIDRENDKDFRIYDYKTGTPKEKLTKDDKRQLSLYQYAVEQLFGMEVARVTYYYLINNKPLDFILSQEDKNDLETWIAKTIQSIKESDFSATPGRHCGHCSYNTICQFKVTSS